MKSEVGNVFATLSMLGALVLASSSALAIQPIDTPEIRATAQAAATRGKHESIARHYEDIATRMQAKLEEQKELLEKYESNSYLYGRQAQDLQASASALIREYGKRMETSRQLAALHHQVAARLIENHAAGTQLPATATGL